MGRRPPSRVGRRAGRLLPVATRRRALAAGDLADLEARLASMARSEPIRGLIASELADPATPAAVRLALLRAMARSGLKEIARGLGRRAWPAPLDDPALSAQAVATARALPIRPDRSSELAPALLQVADRDGAAGRRPARGPRGRPGRALDGRAGVVRVPARPARARPPGLRPDGRRRRPGQGQARPRASIAQLAEARGPGRAARSRPAARRLRQGRGGGDRPEAGRGPQASPGPLDPPRRDPEAPPGPVRPGGRPRGRGPLSRRSRPTRPTAGGTWKRSSASLSGGDVRRGQAVFNGPEGGLRHLPRDRLRRRQARAGPDQDRPGPRRARPPRVDRLPERQLRPELRAGLGRHQGRPGRSRASSGRTPPTRWSSPSAADQEERIPRDQVEEMAPGTVSVMPAGLDRQLTPGELADLIAFLKACR